MEHHWPAPALLVLVKDNQLQVSDTAVSVGKVETKIEAF